MKSYIVTEGASDAALLARLLEHSGLEGYHIATAGGRSSVVSFAKSILASRHSPVAVVIDADSEDPGQIRDQERVYYDLLRAVFRKTAFRIFSAIPEIETILFSGPGVLSRLLNVEIPEKEIQAAKFQPGKVFDQLLLQRGRFQSQSDFVADPDRDAAEQFMVHPRIQSLAEFLRHPTAWSPAYASA